MSIVQSLVHVAAPWKSIYSDSSVVSTTVTTLHVVSMLVGGGLAIAADRMTLRALRHDLPDWRFHLAELHDVHRPVLIMLFTLFFTGVLMAAADLETFLTSPVFWLKLGLVTLLVANGAFVYHTETRVAEATREEPIVTGSLGRRLRLSAVFSLALWLCTAVAGMVLTQAA